MKFKLNHREFSIHGSNRKDIQVMFVLGVGGKALLMYDGPVLGVAKTTEMLQLWDECDDMTLIDSCLDVVEVDDVEAN